MQAVHIDGNPARSRVSISAVMSPVCCNVPPRGCQVAGSLTFPTVQGRYWNGGNGSE